MNTLLIATGLGLFCLIAELINFKKLLIPAILLGLGVLFYVTMGQWGQNALATLGGLDMSHMIGFDNYALAFSGLAIFITALIFMMAQDYYKTEMHHITDYAAIFLFTLTGAIVLFSFNNLAMLFLGIEIVSISMYIMAGSRKFDTRSNEAGFKYFLMGAFASGFLLMGIALVYGTSGSFQLNAIHEYASSNQISPLFYTGIVFMLAAFFFKVSAVPFHFWSPDVYEGAPALVTTIMSTLIKITVFGAFFRLMALAFSSVYAETQTILLVITALTITTGNLIATAQQSFKRMLAYSGISHAGFMLMAILTLKFDSASSLLFYATTYSFANIGAFAIAIPVFFFMKQENIDAFNGLAKKNGALAFILTIFLLSMAGIPPLAGFWAKYYIFSKAIQSQLYTITLIAVVNSIIGVYYYFKVILAMYTKQANETKIIPTPMFWSVIVTCLIITVVLGLMPDTLMNLL